MLCLFAFVLVYCCVIILLCFLAWLARLDRLFIVYFLFAFFHFLRIKHCTELPPSASITKFIVASLFRPGCCRLDGGGVFLGRPERRRRPSPSFCLAALVLWGECRRNDVSCSRQYGSDVVGGYLGAVRGSGERWYASADPRHGWLVVVFPSGLLFCGGRWVGGRASEDGRAAGGRFSWYVRALRVCIFELILCTRAIRAHFMCTQVVLQVICLFYFLPFVFVRIKNYKFFLFPKMLKNQDKITKTKYR